MRCPILQYPTELATKHEATAYDEFRKDNPHDAFYFRTFAQLKDARPEDAQYYLDLTYASSVRSRKLHQKKAIAQLRFAKHKLCTWLAGSGSASTSSRYSQSESFTFRFSSSTLAFMQ